MEARRLKAAAFRKLGYAEMNAIWRNWYLSGARGLEIVDPEVIRAGMARLARFIASPDLVAALRAKAFVEGFAVRLKAEETLDVVMTVGFRFPDIGEAYGVAIRRDAAQIAERAPETADLTRLSTTVSSVSCAVVVPKSRDPNFSKLRMEDMTTQTEPVVLFEVSDGVGWITFNRPKAYNALNKEMATHLLEALIRCDESEAVRAVVITGKGPSFCSGGDIRQMMTAAESDGHAGAFLKTLTVSLHAATATMAHMNKPVITAVNGAAAGAGFSLAIAGDLVLAADNARFTVAYTAIGLAPDGSSTFTLPRLIGPKRAFELMYTNRALSADEAKELGMVNRVFPAAQFTEQVREFAIAIAKGPTAALGCAKRLLTLSAQSSLETQMEHERRAIAACGRTADFREGADAFFAKRPPKFQGR